MSHLADLRTWLVSGVLGALYFYQPLFGWLKRRRYACQDFQADDAAARQAMRDKTMRSFLPRLPGRWSPALA